MIQQGELGAKAPHAPAGRLVQALCFVLFFSVMNATMFNVALSDISGEFRLQPSEVSWIVTGYSVVYALGALLYGKLADKFPLKRLITFGILLFALGSAIGFFSHTYVMVLISRLVQAAGASCVPALVMLIPVRFFPPDQRGRVMGVIASTIAFSSGLGPIVGGFIAGHFHWSGLFLISLFAPVALPFIRKSLPEEEVRDGEKIDMIGAALLGFGVASFMLSVTQFNAWWLLASVIAFVLFAGRTRRHANPFIRPELFRIKGFGSGLLVGFLAMFAVFGVFITTPIMLGEGGLYHFDSQTIGFVLFPAAMSAALLGRFGGRLVDRKGGRYALVVAISGLIIGLLMLSAVLGLPAWWVALSLPFINVSMTFAQASLAKIVSASLPKEQTGIGMGVFNLVNFLSGAISGAVLSKLVEFEQLDVLHVTALDAKTTFGFVYLLLAVLMAANMAAVFKKMRKEPDAASETSEEGSRSVSSSKPNG